MTSPLRKVTRTAEAFEQAANALRESIREARRAGASLREIREATRDRVSDQHIRRICATPEGDTGDTLAPEASETTPVLVRLDRRTLIGLRKTAREQGVMLGDAIRQVLRDQLGTRH
jgi:hypothetical protein